MKTIDNWIDVWNRRPANDFLAEEMFVRGMVNAIQEDAFFCGTMKGLADACNIVRRHDSESETCNLAANEIAAKHLAMESKCPPR